MIGLRYRLRRLRATLRIWSRPRHRITLWLVLALGLLNPAACLVHCAPPHAEMHAAFAGMEHGAWGFLCSVPPAVAPAVPAPDAPAAPSLAPDPSGTPRAVFACALLALSLLPLLQWRRRSRYAGRPALPSCVVLPPLRPPRCA